MDLYDIDRVAVSGRSWLHRQPVAVKLAALLALLVVLLATVQAAVTLALLAVVILLALSARLPVRHFFVMLLYPLFFLVIIFLSIGELSLAAFALVSSRVLAISGAVITFMMTTSYPAVFAAMGRVLPDFLVASLFYTYRSLFILADSLSNARIALHLRGGRARRRPMMTLRYTGMALGHVLIHSIDASRRMADALTVRGFANRVYSLGVRHGR